MLLLKDADALAIGWNAEAEPAGPPSKWAEAIKERVSLRSIFTWVVTVGQGVSALQVNCLFISCGMIRVPHQYQSSDVALLVLSPFMGRMVFSVSK